MHEPDEGAADTLTGHLEDTSQLSLHGRQLACVLFATYISGSQSNLYCDYTCTL